MGEFSKVGVGSGFDVKGVEGSFKVFGKFIEGFFFGINGGVGQMPLLLLILFRVVMTLILSVE